MIPLLAWIGIVRIRDDGTVRWPVHVVSWGLWKIFFRNPGDPQWGWFGVFCNRPGIIKWQPGRLLPRRWGVRILGLEIGDRG